MQTRIAGPYLVIMGGHAFCRIENIERAAFDICCTRCKWQQHVRADGPFEMQAHAQHVYDKHPDLMIACRKGAFQRGLMSGVVVPGIGFVHRRRASRGADASLPASVQQACFPSTADDLSAPLQSSIPDPVDLVEVVT